MAPIHQRIAPVGLAGGARRSLRQMAVNVAHHLTRMGEVVASEVGAGFGEQQDNFFARPMSNRLAAFGTFEADLLGLRCFQPSRQRLWRHVDRLFEVRYDRAGIAGAHLAFTRFKA